MSEPNMALSSKGSRSSPPPVLDDATSTLGQAKTEPRTSVTLPSGRKPLFRR
jgi:hypothetical protein